MRYDFFVITPKVEPFPQSRDILFKRNMAASVYVASIVDVVVSSSLEYTTSESLSIDEVDAAEVQNDMKELEESTAANTPNVFALKTSGDACLRNRQYKKAKTYYNEALHIQRDIIRQRKGEAITEEFLMLHQDLADLNKSIGLVYEATDKMRQAKQYFRLALNIYREILEKKSIFGLDAIQTIIRLERTANQVGNLFYRNYHFEAAMSLYKIALEAPLPALLEPPSRMNTPAMQDDQQLASINIIYSDENDVGSAHKKMLLCRADTLNNMANIYNVLNEPEKSIALYNQALEIQTEVLGESNPTVATTLHNLGTCYRREEKYDEALKTYKRVLELRSQSESDFPAVFDALIGMGLALKTLGERDQALSAYQEALGLGQQNQFKQVKEAAVHNAIGEIHKETHDKEKALLHFRQSLDIYKAIGFTEDHPQVKSVRGNVKAIGFNPDSDMKSNTFDFWSYFDFSDVINPVFTLMGAHAAQDGKVLT